MLEISLSYLPYAVSYLRRCAKDETSAKSFIATTLISFLESAILNAARPIRPNPFIAIFSYLFLDYLYLFHRKHSHFFSTASCMVSRASQGFDASPYLILFLFEMPEKDSCKSYSRVSIHIKTRNSSRNDFVNTIFFPIRSAVHNNRNIYFSTIRLNRS